MNRTMMSFLLGLLTVAPAFPAATAPPAAAADVESIDAVLRSVYDVISGPAEKKRDWERFKSLFLPEAKLIPAFIPKDGGGMTYRAWTPEDYINRSGPILERDGFFEQEIHRVVDQFGPVAQVFSTYESRRRLDDPQPFARGINSFQLYFDGNRWWIVNIYWTSERPDLPIPAKYLP